jgi:antitoxin (DNA-binding transcriptional repressor) of toxin-antitoxin stability system
MSAQLHSLLAKEHIADLMRAAERDRAVRAAKHESLVARLIAHTRRRGRSVADGTPAASVIQAPRKSPI